MLTWTMLTRGSGITSAYFEGGGIKTCADNADTGRGVGYDRKVLLETGTGYRIFKILIPFYKYI